jgi:hemoglobin
MKKDIQNRKDLEALVNRFYEKVKADLIIGYLFNDVAKVNWEAHLPRMYDFWDNIVFQTGGYTGNPMAAHIKLHAQSPLSALHFTQWQKLFLETVDELFKGEKAELAKQRAQSIATMMQWKVISSDDHGSVY